MAGRRRSTRNNDKPPEGESNNTTEDRCPACTNETTANLQFEDKEEWAMCGACKTWYHWRCAGNGEELDTVDKWYARRDYVHSDSAQITAIGTVKHV